ncbi:MAG: hypothetical protein HPY66_2208 [Firmicutes bacterium]|nr:hypothetical protein [Bacillota bacterium]MDI6705604.1 Flp family type IVb pilin [Bacillota bacterium]
MLSMIKNFLSDERGQASTEYGVIIGVIAVGIIAAAIIFRDKIINVFTNAGNELDGI